MPDIWNKTLAALANRANGNGTIPYRIALAVAETLGIEYAFDDVYGEESGWVDSGVDVGEFIAWALPQA